MACVDGGGDIHTLQGVRKSINRDELKVTQQAVDRTQVLCQSLHGCSDLFIADMPTLFTCLKSVHYHRYPLVPLSPVYTHICLTELLFLWYGMACYWIWANSLADYWTPDVSWSVRMFWASQKHSGWVLGEETHTGNKCFHFVSAGFV